PKAVEKWGLEFGKHPVGTGAFQLVEWKPNQEVILEANPGYWGVKPRVKRVVVRNIKDNSQRLGALKAGEIHGMEGLNPDDVAVVKSDPSLQLLLRPTNTTGQSAGASHASRLRAGALGDHGRGRQEGAADLLVHVALAAVLPEPEGDRRGDGG